MKKSLALVVCLAAGSLAFSAHVNAQQKTEKACKDEWQANKAANQAAKITEKAYVEKCRGTAAKPEAAKTPAAAPTKPAAPTPAASSPSQAPAPAASKSAPAKPATATSASTNQYGTE